MIHRSAVLSDCEVVMGTTEVEDEMMQYQMTTADGYQIDDSDYSVVIEVDDEDAGTTYYYRTQAAADRDQDGSRADAWCHRITTED